jgi:hypothetical protein
LPTAARRLALDVLLRVEGERLPLAEILGASEVEALPSRERDLLHELVLGSLRPSRRDRPRARRGPGSAADRAGSPRCARR